MTTRIPNYDILEPTSLTQEEVKQTLARFESLRSQLALANFRGQLAIRGEPLFAKSITIFNDAAPLGGWMVALPVDVHDVSTVVKFCAAHRLSPSIRSGGFATAGWAIQGQVIIDTCLMDDVKLVVPNRWTGPHAADTQRPDSSPLTVPAVGLSTIYHPTGVCANVSDGSDTSSSNPSSSSQPAPSAATAIPPITAQRNADSIPFQSDSVSAADRLVTRQIENPSAISIQHQATELDVPNSETDEIVPQDAAKYVLKRKARDSDQALLRSSYVAAADLPASPAKRRTDTLVPPEQADVKSEAMQHARSHESGADADSESSFASSNQADQPERDVQQQHATTDRLHPSRSDSNSRSVAASRSDFLNASEPRDVAPLFSASASMAESISASCTSLPDAAPIVARTWVDRQLDLSGNTSDSPGGSNSGSNGGRSSSCLASSFTSTSKQSSGKSSSASGEHTDGKVDDDPLGGLTTDDVGEDSAPFKRPSTIPLAKRHAVSLAERRRATRSVSSSGSGSASDSSRQRREMVGSRTPDDCDTNASTEHQRWHQHHRPPSDTPGEKIKLPEGGFVWRSDGVDAGISSISAIPGTLPWDAEAFAANAEVATATQSCSRSSRSSPGEGSSNELDTGRTSGLSHFGASTLSDLQDAWPSGVWAVNQDASNDPTATLPRFIPSPLQKFDSPSITPPVAESGNPYSFDTRPEGYFNTASAISPPGLYEDHYALASFGPGVGIRGLDAFTDRAGREGKFLATLNENTKGKDRQLESPHAFPSLVVNGVPYHVPVSAYPVGSTAMTTGGFGYLTRAYGLSLDNIVEVEMVLADGTIVTLNEQSKNKSQQEQDLWWAVRGAAPCFGIVTRLTAKAYPVPSVYSGNLIYPLNPATASSLIRHWRDCLKAGLPRNFYTNLILTAGPSKTSHVIVIQVCYLGPKSDGEALVQAISSWTGERLLLKDVEERSFLSQQDGVAKVLKGGTGRRWMVRGDLISTLTDDVIAKSVRNFQGLGSRAVWLFELMGGAVEDSPADETCICPQARAAKFTVGSLQQWSGQEEDRTCIESVERWLDEVVNKVSVGGPYPCFLGRSENMDRVIGAYGLDNFKRLLEIKRRVDPSNMFRHTFGQGFVVDDPDSLLAELGERQAARRQMQEHQAQQPA